MVKLQDGVNEVLSSLSAEQLRGLITIASMGQEQIKSLTAMATLIDNKDKVEKVSSVLYAMGRMASFDIKENYFNRALLIMAWKGSVTGRALADYLGVSQNWVARNLKKWMSFDLVEWVDLRTGYRLKDMELKKGLRQVVEQMPKEKRGELLLGLKGS